MKTTLRYIFCQEPPCDLPRHGYVHLIVRMNDEGNMVGIQANYIYGCQKENVLVVEYSEEELAIFNQNIVNGGNEESLFLVDKLVNLTQTAATITDQEDLLYRYQMPCCGNLTKGVLYLLLMQIALVLVFVAWLKCDIFWQQHLLPLFVELPCVEGFVNRHLLGLIAIYIAYLFSTGLELPLLPVLEAILDFINVWDEILVEGCPLETNLFQAQINLGLMKALTDRDIKKQTSSSEITDNRSYASSSGSYESSFVTTDPDEKTCCDKKSSLSSFGSSFVTTDPDEKTCYREKVLPDPSQDYYLLETKKQEVEKNAQRANLSLASHFSTLSNEVVGYAITQVKQRLEGCLEETIYKSYPRIESYIQTCLVEKQDYFSLLKEQLELEVNRVREICQQAFLVLEAVPYYEERIKYLESEIKSLRDNHHGNGNLERKVDHLQSTVTQLLRSVRLRY